MTTNDLVAMLHEAMCELDVLGSYVDDPDIKWPTYGLKVTAKAHKKLAGQIKVLLDTGPAEEIPLREENRALRAALAAQWNDEEWRLKFLAAQLTAGAFRKALGEIHEEALEAECTSDCPPEWARCAVCRIRVKAGAALREEKKEEKP